MSSRFMPVYSGTFPPKFLAENTSNGTNNYSPRGSISGCLGEWEPQVSYMQSIMGCLPGKGRISSPGPGHLAFNSKGSF